jgi:hypothetical protein
LWQRFFELQEQQAENNADILEEVLASADVAGRHGAYPAEDSDGRSSSNMRPVASEEAVRHRKESVTQFYRAEKIQGAPTSTLSQHVVPPALHRTVVQEPSAVTPQRILEDQQVSRPNLDIPVRASHESDVAYISLAQ